MNTSVSVYYPIDRAPARRDLATGALVSLALLAGAYWISDAAKRAYVAPAPAAHHELASPLVLPPDLVLATEVETAPAPSANPAQDVKRQVDVPLPPSANPFVQPPEVIPANIAYDPHAVTAPPTWTLRPGDPIYDPNSLDVIPAATFQPAPAYPYAMKSAGISGVVLIDFIVEANGTTSHVFVSGGRSEFGENAVQAVSHWRFHPGRKLGRAVRTHMVVPVRFTLEREQ